MWQRWIGWSVWVLLSGTLAAGEPRMIGNVQGRGVSLDSTGGAGAGTLAAGTLVTSGGAAATIRLTGGAVLDLAARGEARIYADRAELQRGVVRLREAPGTFRIVAGGLQVAAQNAQPQALVGFDAVSKKVEVRAGSAPLQIASAAGRPVAQLAAGTERSFGPRAADTGRMQVAGCLRSTAGRLWLVDETSNLTIEVSGADLAKEAGNRVQVSGGAAAEAPASGAAYRIEAHQWSRLSRGCGPGPGKAAAAGTSGAGSGAGSGTLIAIVGGVAVAAAMGGLVAAGSFSGEAPTPPVSR